MQGLMMRSKIYLLVALVSLFLQGCFQDYTVMEKQLVSGKLLGRSERQEVGFQYDQITSFPIVEVSLGNWATVDRQIVINRFAKLPVLSSGEFFELWANFTSVGPISFGKFVQFNGSLWSYNGSIGTDRCTSFGSSMICTFAYEDTSLPLYPGVERIEISIEPSSGAGSSGGAQQGSLILAGDVVNESGGLVNPLNFPVPFSQSGITSTASAYLYVEEAKEGRLTLNLKGFPFLDNKFAYGLWSIDDIGGASSCGIFNVRSGVIVHPVTFAPKNSNIFSCGVDLTQRTELIISLEPMYEGNSEALFQFQPFQASYQSFNNTESVQLSLYNLRASIAGSSTDRSLTDVEGNFSVMTSYVGPTYVVFRGLDWEPSFQAIVVEQGMNGKSVTGIAKEIVPKAKGTAVFHLFENDYSEKITVARVVGSFQSWNYDNGLVMNDNGENGDLVKGDGVWTVVANNLGAGNIDYQFAVNGDNRKGDLHAESIGSNSRMRVR